jgi:hypothetical protein
MEQLRNQRARHQCYCKRNFVFRYGNMKRKVRVEFSSDFGANQLFKAQLLLQCFVYVISRNLGVKPRDKQCLGPFGFRDDRQG